MYYRKDYKKSFAFAFVFSPSILYIILVMLCFSYRMMVKSTLVLLPLLGLTWVLGLFAVVQNTSIFAWMFTIVNSLQVTQWRDGVKHFLFFCIIFV